MADSFTANLNLRKPEVGAANDTWGGTAGLNSDMDIIDAIFLATGLGTPVGLHIGDGKVLGVDGTGQLVAYASGISFLDADDPTKIMKIDVSLIPTGTTCTYTFPGSSGTVNVVTTGTIQVGYWTVAPAGYVLASGNTIGQTGSLATERANDDTLNLYTLFWNLGFTPVAGGRGASASADFLAGKIIALPDHRGRVMAGIDYGTPANRLTSATMMPDGVTLAATGGIQNELLTVAQMANLTVTAQPTGPANNLPFGTGATAFYGTTQTTPVSHVQPTILVNVAIAL